MQLQFVGCGDAFGSGGRFNTCFHLVGRGINALIDCGATSLVSMNKLAINRNDIDVIFISHFHADHIGALPFFTYVNTGADHNALWADAQARGAQEVANWPYAWVNESEADYPRYRGNVTGQISATTGQSTANACLLYTSRCV